MLDNQGVGVRFSVGVRCLSLLYNVQTACGAHPTFYAMATGAVSPEVKWKGSEPNHSLLSRSEVKIGGAIPPLPLRLHVVVLN